MVVRVNVEDEKHALSIIYEQEDQDYSLTDALSFVVLERMGIRHAFAFDSHFAQYGFTVLGPDNL